MNKKKFSRYQVFIVLVLSLLQFTVVLDFVVLSPLGDQVIKALSISPAQFGWLVSSYAFSAGISGILTAGFADKYDRKKLLLFFYSGFILGTLFCGLSGSFTMLLLARIFTGLFGGVIASISLTIVTDLFHLDQRGRVMGFVQMGFAVSQILGIPIGLQLAILWGWNAIFIAIVGLALIVLFLLIRYMKPITRHLELAGPDHNALMHLVGVIRNKSYRIAFSLTSLVALAGFMLMPFASVFLVNNVKITHEELPMVFMFTGVTSIIALPLIGRLSDRVSKFKVFAWGSVLAIIMTLVYTNMPILPFALVVLINMLLFISTSARMVPGTAMITAVPGREDRGAFMSVNSSLQQVSGGIAAMIAGLIVVQENPGSPIRHYNTLGFITTGLFLTGIIMALRVYRLIKIKARGEAAGKITPSHH